MENRIQLDQNSEDFYNSCDLLLIELFINSKVNYGFPGVPFEVVEELQRLELIKIADNRCLITRQGKMIVKSGGLKRFIATDGDTANNIFLINKRNILLEYPVVITLLIGLLMLICVLTWFYVLLHI